MMDALEKLLEWGGTKRDIIFLVISGLALVVSGFDLLPLPFDAAWIAIILCGLPIILEAIHGLVTAFDIKADVLVSMALIASVIVGEDFAAGEVAFIMQLGGLLEELTVAKARAGIEKLVHLTPRTARIVSADGREDIVAAEQARVNDLVRVLPGETIPVDGVIVSGKTSVNQALMTGESLPVDKHEGDEVFSGTVNQYGAFDMRALKVGEDSSLQRMIRLVQSADASKAKIVGLADRWATWIVVIALVSAFITWCVTGEILRSVTILVVFCPCALVLATPTAIMAAIGNATHHRFLVREGDALERLARVTRVAFDKTGTLTTGTPAVKEIYTFTDKYNRDTLYALAAAVEQKSEHPLGKALVASYRETLKKNSSSTGLKEVTDFVMTPGKGVAGLVDGHRVRAGNRELMEDLAPGDKALQLAEPHAGLGHSVIYIAVDDELAGMVALADSLRPDAASTIANLKKVQVEPVLLTGDHENAARTIASQVSIREVHPNCLPEDKLNFIDRSEAAQAPVCMIGDGINDAPALRKARVGIAMGGVGSDIAIDAADIVLVNDDIAMLPHLFALSKRTMRTITANLTFSMVLNFVAIILAMTAVLNPVTGALVHNAGSVFVIVNSIFLLNWKSAVSARVRAA